MKQFDFHRFVLALKCHFVTTRSIWLRVFSLQFIALFLWQLFFLWSSFYSRNYTDESAEVVHSIYYNAIDQIAGFSIVFIGIAMLFGAVCMFTGLKPWAPNCSGRSDSLPTTLALRWCSILWIQRFAQWSTRIAAFRWKVSRSNIGYLVAAT